ncbi:similar to Saccharomyces cerevisiae YJL056C ZAP1 Zinc-regulated transcription factor [Maudiozyma barnettii]|uniref:Similar to Saccharomyces cerevisiae YJL056C ZAP1 Zinc-regulated transcription factor n=1 Tax=Maudiozyma barnettii TaxID=61262 RepID=A0A8H2VDH1_9SACH|nr:Zap1p [Kazachstania barnettii]CAB4253278.1 similar to Saccharomyces cerevisiae YJL056C ZAP1 Zinc-regulated transcription factor [Kazachstania barnettii]CAD1780186.1 similar to Saccharomyces cerevisiae YJL056C ZAP1 Zinc-regulated transcription factor [Kazachstania barnettii]
MKLNDTDCKGQFQEGIVHGHIHNFNNMTYIHGHIHHNASHLPNSDGLGTGITSDDNLKTNDIYNDNVRTNDMSLGDDSIGDSTSHMEMNPEKVLESDFMDCEHFEFMDTNGTLPDNFANNFNNSFHMDGSSEYGSNWNKNGLLETHINDGNNNNGSSYRMSKSKSRDHRVSLSDDMLNLPLSKKRRLSSSSDKNQDGCPCNPKMVEVCCNVDHADMPKDYPVVENISLNSHPKLMIPNDNEVENLPYYGARSSSSPHSKMLNQYNTINNVAPITSSGNIPIRKSNKIGELNNDFAKQFLDLNCDLTCEPNCLDKYSQAHPSNTQGSMQVNNSIKQGNEKININIKRERITAPILTEDGPMDTSLDGKDDMLETFFKACQRVGESNENDKLTKSNTDTISIPQINHQCGNNSNQYHKHTSNRQLDMQIISDICAISSLYEMPLADHMNHHHHKHNEEPLATGEPIPRSESFNLLESVVNCKPTRVISKNKSTSDRLSQIDEKQSVQQQQQQHLHHHHKIQFHDHNTSPIEPYQSDKTVSWERFKKDYKGSTNKLERSNPAGGINSSNDETLILYHNNEQRPIDQIKLEPLNTIHFNWNFKTNDQFSETIECKWAGCHKNYSSLIELQRHLFNDHITEYELPLNPSTDPTKDPIANCKWENCDFNSNDICSFVNHINSKHGINFDMEFVDSGYTTMDDKYNGTKTPHHMYHCKNTDCQTTTSPDSTTARESITSVDYSLSPNTSFSNNTDMKPVKTENTTVIDIPKDSSNYLSKDKIIHCKWLDCTAIFKNEAELDHHLESFHIPKGQSSYQCHWRGCDRTLPTRQKMVRHIRKHSGDKPFKCTECSKCFATKESLKQHGRTHTGERPFKCPYCDKSFATSTFVNIHVRMHTGEKPLECPYCHKRFSESSNLNKHIKTHLKKYKGQDTNRSLATENSVAVQTQNL